MRRICVVLALVTVILGCGGGGRQASLFWDGSGDVEGIEALYRSEADLPTSVSAADAIVVAKVSGIRSVETAGPMGTVHAQDPADQARVDAVESFGQDLPLGTTYLADVQTWLKGSGASTISIEGAGGYMASTNQWLFLDGTFLLEPDRTYLLMLHKTDTGAYQYGLARSNFDLTGGVHVLNHWTTRDLEHFEQMSVDDFVAYVKGLVDAPSKTVTPPSDATAAPAN